jgi:hypothetical protein
MNDGMTPGLYQPASRIGFLARLDQVNPSALPNSDHAF